MNISLQKKKDRDRDTAERPLEVLLMGPKNMFKGHKAVSSCSVTPTTNKVHHESLLLSCGASALNCFAPLYSVV